MNPDANLGNEALDIVLAQEFKTVLDIGCGLGHQTKRFQKAGKEVTSVDRKARFDGVIETDYLKHEFRQHDVVWCSHALEHVLDTQPFIDKLIKDCKDGGIIAITVPPLKHQIVGGHVSLWNAGLLLYRLVLSGLDCSKAKVGTYGYNISVVVKKKMIEPMPELTMGNGDLETLSPFFPLPVHQGFNGEDITVNWDKNFREPASPKAEPQIPTKASPASKPLESDHMFEWREVPSEFESSLPKHLFWIKSDTGAWGNWPSNGPIAELYKHGQDWIKHVNHHRTVIQAGGNCGMYAYWYSTKFDTVHSFEPDPDSYKCLRANSRLRDNIQYYNSGLGDENKKATLTVKDRKNVGTHKIVTNANEGIQVDIITIDSIGLTDVDLIHLDVEGYEEHVIKGARSTIETYKPVIVTERPVSLLETELGYKNLGRAHDHVYVPNS